MDINLPNGYTHSVAFDGVYISISPTLSKFQFKSPQALLKRVPLCPCSTLSSSTKVKVVAKMWS